MLRAWKGLAEFQGRASLRTWLYQIATRACFDLEQAPQRRALPMDLIAPGHVPAITGGPVDLATASSEAWLGPIGDVHLMKQPEGPHQRAELRDSVRLSPWSTRPPRPLAMPCSPMLRE